MRNSMGACTMVRVGGRSPRGTGRGPRGYIPFSGSTPRFVYPTSPVRAQFYPTSPQVSAQLSQQRYHAPVPSARGPLPALVQGGGGAIIEMKVVQLNVTYRAVVELAPFIARWARWVYFLTIMPGSSPMWPRFTLSYIRPPGVL